MNWLSLGLQLLSLRNSFVQSRDAIDHAKAAAERAAEKGIRAAMFVGFCAVATIFFMTGLIVLILELGLQADRGEFLRFSGLIGSSIAFFVLAGIIVAVGAIITREPKESAVPTYVPPPRVLTPEEELRRVGSVMLNRFLSRMKERRPPPRSPGPGPGMQG